MTANTPLCPSRSPETNTSCALPDDERRHLTGHERWLDKFNCVSWAVTQDDYTRWRQRAAS